MAKYKYMHTSFHKYFKHTSTHGRVLMECLLNTDRRSHTIKVARKITI